MNETEIVERSSGYWLVDKSGVVDGPFIDLEDAVEALEKENGDVAQRQRQKT